MPRRKKEKVPITAMDETVLEEVLRIKEFGGPNEGATASTIAGTIWNADDAYDAVLMIMKPSKTKLVKAAEMGAVIARVVALACQEARAVHGAVAIQSYKKFFYYLGAIGPSEAMLHHATSHLSRWGGFDVEIDHYVAVAQQKTEKDAEYPIDADYSIYAQLQEQQDSLGCGDLLNWQAVWKYGVRQDFDYPQYMHKSGKFDDFTNFLLRWDSGCDIRPTDHLKLAEHKGDFAAYMEKHFDSQKDSDIFNPGPASQKSQMVSTSEVPVSDMGGAYYVARRRLPTTKFAHLQRYRNEYSRKEKQEFFNPYHDFDQLDHRSIEKAIAGYATGSAMFWTLFALDSMCNGGAAVQNLAGRAKHWKKLGKVGLLPINTDCMIIAEQLAEEFLAGKSYRLRPWAGAKDRSLAIQEPKNLKKHLWWKEWREQSPSTLIHAIPHMPGAGEKAEEEAEVKKKWEGSWGINPNRAAPLDEKPLELIPEQEAPVRDGKIKKTKSWADQQIEVDEEEESTKPNSPGDPNSRNSTRKDLMELDFTPMAAAAEHREAMRNQFYL